MKAFANGYPATTVGVGTAARTLAEIEENNRRFEIESAERDRRFNADIAKTLAPMYERVFDILKRKGIAKCALPPQR